jgi:hypothetical protein
MRSRIVGVVSSDRDLLSAEADKILALEFNSAYSEFLFGHWKNCVLWNQTGRYTDFTLREYEGAGRPTELMAGLHFVDSLITNTVRAEYVKWVRAFVLEDGILLPHRDYLEMDDGFTRLHIVLKTNDKCLHSEEDEVFHMRAGEAWFLEARNIHCACNFGSSPRVSLCVDFVPQIPISQLFKDSSAGLDLPLPAMILRKAFRDSDVQAVFRPGEHLNVMNLRNIAGALATIHFGKKTNAGAMFDWLRELAASSHEPGVVEEVESMTRLALGVAGSSVGQRLSV